MLRSLYSGVSGMQSFQTSMDVIGNNIANVNTSGFKSSNVNYESSFYQTLEASKQAYSGSGGVNPKQIGYGSAVASVSKLMTQGSFQNTGKNTDLAIQGDGFFVLSNGTKNYYTRAGSFDRDENGTFVQSSSGLKLQGWSAVYDQTSGSRYVDTNQPVGDITVSDGTTMSAKKTSSMTMSGNLDADVGPESFVMTVTDASGNNVDVTFSFTRNADDIKAEDPFDTTQQYTWNASWTWDGAQRSATGKMQVNSQGSVESSTIDSSSFYNDGRSFSIDDNGTTGDYTDDTVDVTIPTSGNMTFYEASNPTNKTTVDYNSPSFTTPVKVYDTLGNAYTLYLDFVKLAPQYTDSNNSTYSNSWMWRARTASGEEINYLTDYDTGTTAPNSLLGGFINFDSSGRVENVKYLDSNGQVLDNIEGIEFDGSGKGDGTIKIKNDMSNITQFVADSDAYVSSQDGNAQGTIESFSINDSGEITGSFSNGLVDKLGKIALANFNNPGGLNELGNSLYGKSSDSGDARTGSASNSGFGSLIPGALEMSNVDLSEEFSKLIIAQRGFQANSRVITTSDDILQEIVNLKR
jgi:flagellar hook protein FlgE